ncbi:hypothetical protein ACFO1V_14075 [Daeguia caeni]|uniref:Uncharacterized protein n=1 Tax=Daeguia caeni TaxID=439612 RepID=A0ABV9H9S9_9HYPH
MLKSYLVVKGVLNGLSRLIRIIIVLLQGSGTCDGIMSRAMSQPVFDM